MLFFEAIPSRWEYQVAIGIVLRREETKASKEKEKLPHSQGKSMKKEGAKAERDNKSKNNVQYYKQWIDVDLYSKLNNRLILTYVHMRLNITTWDDVSYLWTITQTNDKWPLNQRKIVLKSCKKGRETNGSFSALSLSLSLFSFSSAID